MTRGGAEGGGVERGGASSDAGRGREGRGLAGGREAAGLAQTTVFTIIIPTFFRGPESARR